MIERGHSETGHVLRIHISDRCGAAAHPNSLALQNRDGELTDHALHESHALKDGVVEL